MHIAGIGGRPEACSLHGRRNLAPMFAGRELDYLSRIRPRLIVVCTDERDKYVAFALENIQKGVALLSAGGRWISVLHDIMEAVEGQIPGEETVLRRDSEEELEGRKVRQVKVKLISRQKLIANILAHTLKG